MILAYSLGVGPGWRYLLPDGEHAGTVEGLEANTNNPRSHPPRRSQIETEALHGRVLAAIERREDRAEIARRERITVAYVSYIVHKNGGRSLRRERDEITQLVCNIRRAMLHNPKRPHADIAREMGISDCYLAALLKRYPDVGVEA